MGHRGESQCLPDSRPLPGLALPHSLLPSTWYFLIALGKTLVTLKQTAALSRPVWSVSHDNTYEGEADKGEVLSGMQNGYYTAIFSSPKGWKKTCTGSPLLHCCFKARIGEVHSGTVWLPQAWMALPGQPLCCSGRPLGLSQVLVPNIPASNIKYVPPVQLFVVHESASIPLEPIYIPCFYPLPGVRAPWTY